MRLLVACAVLVLALVLTVRFGGSRPAPEQVMAEAAPSACVKALVQDWFEDGRVDRSYPRFCYESALGFMPDDGEVPAFEEILEKALR